MTIGTKGHFHRLLLAVAHAALCSFALFVLAQAPAVAFERKVPEILPSAFGARCVGPSFDDTEALQAAFDTGKTVRLAGLGGDCNVTRALILKTPGQLILGETRWQTRFNVRRGFVGDGVFVFRTGEPGPIIRDIGITFVQPTDPTEPSELTSFPPAFYARDTPRFELMHIGCYTATICVDMKGNSGGSKIEDFQLSAFQVGIDLDGSLDTVRLRDIHAWPFRTTPNEAGILINHVTWVRSGKVDDLNVSDSLFLGGTGFDFYRSNKGNTTGSMTNVDFDNAHRGIVISDGRISISGGYFAGGSNPGDQNIVMKSGVLGLTGTSMDCPLAKSATPVPAISALAGFLTIVGSPAMSCGAYDRPVLSVEGGTVILNDNLIAQSPNIAYLQPRIVVKGAAARLTAIGNRLTDKGTGQGTFISIEVDNYHRVIGNTAPGWSNTVANRPMPNGISMTLKGVYLGN